MTAAAERKVAKDLENLDPDATVDVIVQYRQVPTASQHQKMRNRGGKHKTDLSLIQASHYSLRSRELADLENDPDVISVSPDREVFGTLDIAVQAVNGTLAQANGFKGTGVGVAVIDSGVDAPDVAS